MSPSGSGRVEGEVLIGLALMVTGMLIVPSIDACAKLLSLRMPPLEISLARFVVQSMLIGTYAAVRGLVVPGLWRELWPTQILGQFLRGAALALTTLLFFAGLAVMPMADTLAITFVEPILLTALSALILHEKVLPRRWIACAIGLVGTMAIVRPSFAVFGLKALLPLCAAMSFACYHLLTRHLAGKASIIAAQFTTGLAGVLVLGPALLVTSVFGLGGQIAVLPTSSDLPLMVAMGLVAVIGHALVLLAYDRAAAAVLAPFGYLEIVSTTALGFLIFGDFPAWPTWIGIALIVGSGLYTIIGEHQDMQPIEPGE